MQPYSERFQTLPDELGLFQLAVERKWEKTGPMRYADWSFQNTEHPEPGRRLVIGDSATLDDEIHLEHAVAGGCLRVLSLPATHRVTLDAPVIILRNPVPLPVDVHAALLISFIDLGGEVLAPTSQYNRVVSVGHEARDVLPTGTLVWQLPAPRSGPPDRSRMCQEPCGFTIWHLAALGLLEPNIVEQVVPACADIADATLDFDLREYCTCAGWTRTWTGPRSFATALDGWPVEEVELVFSHRSSLELSAMVGQAFLAAYADLILPLRKHPLLTAAIRAT